MNPDKEKYSGALIGQCLGDALGFAVEGRAPELCEEYVKLVLRAPQPKFIGRGNFAFGQYTDDSQLARELIESYVALGRFEPADYAQRIAAIFEEGRIVGRGRATEEAAWRLVKGTPWQSAGTPPPSAGNGSAMRAGPIGLIFWDDAAALIQAAHDQGRITHADPRCSAGAVAIAGAVALAIRGVSADPALWVPHLAEWSETIDADFAQSLRRLVELVALPPGEAVQIISVMGLSPDYDDGWRGISPFVTGSVLWSLYSFLRTPDDYWETICTAIAVGGDVDTTAAMAGSISGAYLGLARLPQALAYHLSDRGTWGYSELVELAHQCYAIKHGRAVN